jgi:hypothetical protein
MSVASLKQHYCGREAAWDRTELAPNIEEKTGCFRQPPPRALSTALGATLPRPRQTLTNPTPSGDRSRSQLDAHEQSRVGVLVLLDLNGLNTPLPFAKTLSLISGLNDGYTKCPIACVSPSI